MEEVNHPAPPSVPYQAQDMEELADLLQAFELQVLLQEEQMEYLVVEEAPRREVAFGTILLA